MLLRLMKATRILFIPLHQKTVKWEVTKCFMEWENWESGRGRVTNKLSQMCGKYPKLLRSVSLEDLVFCGTKIEFTGHGKSEEYIPPVDPLLFNCFYYLVYLEKDAQISDDHFDPTWWSTYTEGYNKQNCPLCRWALVLILDVLYHHNKNNVYPLHIIFADLF